jgi:hypothetical protein
VKIKIKTPNNYSVCKNAGKMKPSKFAMNYPAASYGVSKTSTLKADFAANKR